MDHTFLFQQPPPAYIRALPPITLLFLSYLCFSEIIGKHLQYSKFWNVNSQSKSNQIKLSSKTGMLFLYGPAFLAGVASFGLFPYGGLRFLLLKSALTIHFFKRILEVLFVHKFSGGMVLDSAILISGAYFSLAASMIYVQHLTEGLPQPSIDLKYQGVVIFLVGISGNFYHHYLLSKLREKGDRGYKLPKGGLFNLVLCPHYLFEILAFWGIFFVSQTALSLSCALGVALYLAGRSFVTRKWYLSKFENFPGEVKALVPFVF
ncbi:steroid 5-alpha-reductase DET2-like [Rhododendron vialii]|uniref:steroid 5-alpha-reductase DET2-like n=1 Tax=Rhododendron vialii TaxID=182163 RepID=UPI00265F0964|nr:steroid 5-alpha-reductase DET2-like [Rhododendron vialii]